MTTPMLTRSRRRDTGDETMMVFRRRRMVELFMDLVALAIALGGWAVTELDLHASIPNTWPTVVGFGVGITLLLHLVVRFVLPWADPLILPCVIVLNGLGLDMIHRLDQVNQPPSHDAGSQLIWTGLGVALFVATLLLLRDPRSLQRFPYLLFLVGLLALLTPLVPGLGMSRGGSTIWIHLGSYSFQPSEAAKVVLSIAFAAYLVEHRELLSEGGRRLLGQRIPRVRDLGPILVMWLASLAVLVFENDLGTSMLFFGLFVMMLYVATERPAWPILGGLLFVVGAWAAATFSAHVKVRVNAWLHPFDNFDQNYQVIQAQYGYAWGGLTGRGWGLGHPGMTPLAKSDFIAAALGEELGIIGLMAVVMVYGLIVARGLKTSLTSADPFSKLMSAGLSFVFALQVFSIIGGVTRLLPLTGLTTPFMSQGGSSMVMNWIVIALLLIVSHHARRPAIGEDAAAVHGSRGELVGDDTAVIKGASA